MSELKLLRVGDDGANLVLASADGTEFTLPVTEELRRAVRLERAVIERVLTSEEPLTPREIQSLLRAGASVDEVAELSGQSPDHVRKYEGPIAAERAWVIQQAQALPVGRHPDSPNLGDLALDRLATRKVDPDSLEWDAMRTGTGPWTLRLTFPVEGIRSEASWEVDLTSRSLHALDDEARWLSETDTSSPRGRRGFDTVVAAFPTRGEHARAAEPEPGPEAPAADPAGATGAGTDSLLESLQQSRGVRLPLPDIDDEPDLLDELGDEEDAHGGTADAGGRVVPLRAREIPEATGATDAPEAPAATEADEVPPAAPGEAERPAPSKARRNRRSVPSWDEIVFGSKGD